MAKEREMGTGVERSKALHNFTMPCDLRWGNQRHLRCMRVNSEGQIAPPRRQNQGSCSYNQSIQQRRTIRDRDFDGRFSGGFMHGSPVAGSKRGGGDEDEDGIAAMREKVMLDLQTAAERMQYAIWKDGRLEEERKFVNREKAPPPPPPPPPPHPLVDRPWNLRTRRAACKMPITSGNNGGSSSAAVGASTDSISGKDFRFDSPRPNSGLPQIRSSVPTTAFTTHKATLHRIHGDGDIKERPKFSVPLLKREIEEDFFSMVGHRPPRRPKKRTKTVQKEMDSLFPGLWLSEITADLYRVAESAAP